MTLTIFIFAIVIIIASVSIISELAYSQNSTNSTTNSITNNTNSTIENNATETVRIYLANAQDNAFTGGLSYDPVGYEVTDDLTGNITIYEIGSGYKSISLSDEEITLSFNLRIPDPTNPTAYSVYNLDTRSVVEYVDTVKNVIPEYAKDNPQIETDDLLVYTARTYSPPPDGSSDPYIHLYQTSPTEAQVIITLYKQ